MQSLGQTVPVGLVAKQTVHDDERRWSLATVCRRLVRRVRHFDRPRRVAQQPPKVRQRVTFLEETRKRRFELDHRVSGGEEGQRVTLHSSARLRTGTSL